jgi:hypothetical protein
VKVKNSHKTLLKAIFLASYTPLELREFVRVCHNHALPLIRRKMAAGKLSLGSLRMGEQDVIYDCLADLFERTEDGHFVQIEQFFHREGVDVESASEELLIESLRRIVFKKVNTDLIRLYCDADPTIGKIIHNLEMALQRTRIFEKIHRYGEPYLVPCDVDVLLDRPPMPSEYLQQQFYRVVIIHESLPEMLKRLREVICGQKEFQRAASLMSIASLLRQVYAVRAESETQVENTAEGKLEGEGVHQAIRKTCDGIRAEMYERYVANGKKTQEQFEMYMLALRKILSDAVNDGASSSISFYEHLRAQMPTLTQKEYQQHHRTVLEYLARIARQKLRDEMAKS